MVLAIIVSLYFEGYGCTANQGETLELAQRARELGHEVCDKEGEADLVVLGTCTVIQTTADRMEHRLKTLLDEGKQVIVAGCMATADRKLLEQRYPQVPRLAPGDTGGLEELIGRGVCQPERQAAPVTAILPIASGCFGQCTYCATLRARGRVRSRPVKEIVERARTALESGTRELLLTSQDNGAFGGDTGSGLNELMVELAKLSGDHRIRIGMLNPALAHERASELAEAWAGERVYKFLHLPVQTGSDRLLETMARDHSLEQFWQVVETFRGRYSELMLSTDIICGFPGETEEDHRATIELLERLRPEVVNITRFSARPFTPAAKMEDQVPFQAAKERSRELTKLRQRLGQEAFNEQVGKEATVLAIEPGKPGTMLCRDECYRPVVVEQELESGTFHEVKITGAHWAYLIAKKD